MRVLVLGASGMLGNAMLEVLGQRNDMNVYGTVRSASAKQFFSPAMAEKLIPGCDVENQDALQKVFADTRPDVVINCVGLIKQVAETNDVVPALQINALLPHRLSRLCDLTGSRLVHISTDCVFSGSRGGYTEEDESDAKDVYGKTKFLGEVHDSHCLTLRTSIIGHELKSNHGLIDWFLSQQHQCKGYTKAIFSGVPTVVLAKLVSDIITERPDLSGLYHVSSEPITKHDLLKLVAEKYNKSINILPDESVKIDRSLNDSQFRAITGYPKQDWNSLVQQMYSYYQSRAYKHHV